MDEILEGLLHEFISHSSENGDLTYLTENLTIGFVVDADDPLQMGRLRVFVPAFNDDPKKLLHLPWCSMVSPMAGSIDSSAYVRGSQEGNDTSSGPIHYGFWSVPEVGAHVLVGCINGDARRRFWLGCFPQHQETHTIGHGRFQHENNNVDGPLTSTGGNIEPTATKLKEAFNNETDSSEWKTRGVEYQVTSVTEAPSPNKSMYVDDDLDAIQNSELDEWVRDILGEHGYDWTGYKSLGAFLVSRAHTWTTPGFHSFTMDDRPFNCRIRLRTVGGNQIILDDTNERMYFSTSGGKSWLEMDAAGNIDVYAERRLSIHAERDLNLSAGESIRMKANNFISMYAGDNRGQTPLGEEVAQGQIRIQASENMHLISEGSLLMRVDGDADLNLTGDLNLQSVGDINIASQSAINLDGPNIDFRVSGKDTTVNDLVDFLDEFVADVNDFRDDYNSHVHGGSGPPSPQFNPAVPEINDEGLPANPTADPALLAPWTNRVPEHEPWPRVMMQDGDDTVNTENAGYANNVDWVEQYDNETRPEGREPIGRTEGDETIERGRFWRR